MYKNVLIVAYVFPPIAYAGTYRSLRLCRGLEERGIETHVLTINIYDDIHNDHPLLEKIPRQVAIHRTPIIDPWRWFQNWKKRHQNMWGFTMVNRIVSFFLWFLCQPDHMVLWVPFALARGIRIIREHGIGTVYVSSPPHSTQIIGLLLKKITGVRLIVDLRDPIVGNPFDSSFQGARGLRSWIERKLKNYLEHSIVTHADKIVVNTETYRKVMTDRYGKEIFVTVRNSFDKSDYNDIEGRKYDSFTIAHVGTMYGLRQPDALFRAIKRVEKIRGAEQLTLQVLFVGLNEPRLLEGIVRYGVERYVKVLPMVPHHKAIEIMMRSHLLLLIKSTGTESFCQIPGKFFEYVGTGNKILYLGPLESEVAGIIRDMNAGFVFEDDESELAEVISREYDVFIAGGTGRMKPTDIEQFNSECMVNKMIALI